jgi:hypothetical protein
MQRYDKYGISGVYAILAFDGDLMSDSGFIALIFVGLIAPTMLVVTGIVALINEGTESHCHDYAIQTSREVKMSGGFWARTCYVKTDTGWFDIDQVRSVDN